MSNSIIYLEDIEELKQEFLLTITEEKNDNWDTARNHADYNVSLFLDWLKIKIENDI